MAWAIEQQLVEDPTARHVLLCLANYADKEGRHAFPSAATLAIDTGLTERAVRMKLSALSAVGAIRLGNQAIVAAHITRADRRPVVYDLCITGVHPVHPVETGGISRPHGVNVTPARGEPGSPKPSFNHPRTGARAGARGTGSPEKQQQGGEVSGRQPPVAEVMAAAKPDPSKITAGVGEAALESLRKELRC